MIPSPRSVTINQDLVRGNGPADLILSIKRNLGTTPQGPLPTVDRFGRAGRAFLFDGVDDFLEVPSNPSLALQQFTVNVIFKLLRLPTGSVTVSTPVQAPVQIPIVSCLVATHYFIDVNQGGYLVYGHDVSGGNWMTTCFEERLELNRYYQVAAAYAGRILRLAINGVIKLENVNTPELVPNVKPLLVGNRPYSADPAPFHGAIDEVHVYDWALPNEDITRLYKSGTL